MNKKIIIILILLAIMLIPFKFRLKDGGSVEYKSILYSVTKVHALNEQSSTGYEDGLRVKILGIKVYDVVNIYVEARPKEN